MNRFTLHVPEQYNDGAAVDPDYFRGFVEAEILRNADGFTLTHGIGAYRGDCTTYREPVRLYVIDTNESFPRWLSELSRKVAADLSQEAVYVTVATVSAHLFTPIPSPV